MAPVHFHTVFMKLFMHVFDTWLFAIKAISQRSSRIMLAISSMVTYVIWLVSVLASTQLSLVC